MYNFYHKKLVQPSGCATKLLLIMKLTTVILITAILQVSASTYGQRVTLLQKNAKLENVFEQLRQQTGYDFLIASNLLSDSGPVNINVQDQPLEDVLKSLCQQQSLSYQIKDRSIIFSRSRQSKGFLERLQNYITAVDLHGRVTDSTGNGLSGATIKIQGQSKTVTTNQNGEFLISASPGSEVTVSFVGYQTYSFNVSAGQKNITIILHELSGKLQEIVVNNGYQKISKERITGSFEKIDSALINRTVSTDIFSRLLNNFSSLYPDLLATRNLQVRGLKTINSTDQGALIVVDNFEYSGDLNNINPNDVESVVVLKDAAAASIWGSRAGNGVIVITTKKGKLNQKPNLSFNSNLSFTERPQLLKTNQISTSDYIDVEKYLFANGKYAGDFNNPSYPIISPVVEILNKAAQGQITDQQAEALISPLRGKDVRNDYLAYLYRVSAKQQYALSVSGGSEKVGYRISAGYDHNLDNLVGNGYTRTTISSTLDMKPIKNLDISANINLAQSKQTNNGLTVPITLGGLANSYLLFPYSSLKAANGSNAYFNNFTNSFVDTVGNGRLLDWRYNPIDEIALADNSTLTKYASINMRVGYRILNGLSIAFTGQHDDQRSEARNYHSKQTYYTRDLINRFTRLSPGAISYTVPNSGILDYSNADTYANSLRGQLNYDLTLNNRHQLTFIAGSEVRSVINDIQGDRIYGYDKQTNTSQNVDLVNSYPTYDNLFGNIQIPSYGTSRFIKRTNNYFSLYANGSYTYDQKYVLTASIRNDESNLFGVKTNNKGLPLYSGGLSWNISKESFFKVPVFDDLRLKVNYGTRGIINNSVSALVTLEARDNAKITNLPYNAINNFPNPELRYEKVVTTNIGTEFSLLKGRITADFNYYREKSLDLIAFIPYDPTSGYTQVQKNSANLTNKGFDLTLNAKIIRSPFHWDASLLLNHNKTVVTKYLLNDPNASPGLYVGQTGISPIEGLSPYNFITYKWAGLNPQTGAPRGYVNGQISENYSDLLNKATWSDLVVAGSRVPTTRGTLRNTFSYKNASLSLSIGYAFNYYFQRNALNYSTLFLGGNGSGTDDYARRWQKPGDEQTTNVPSMIYPANSDRDVFYQNSSINLEKADNIRVNDLTFSYKINPIVLRRIFRDGITIYGSMYNLGILWKATKYNVDPDAQSIPPSKSYAIGFKMDL